MDTTVVGNVLPQVGYGDRSRDQVEETQPSIGLPEVLALIRARRRFIGVFLVIGIAFVVMAVASMQNTYTATATLVLERDSGQLLQSITNIVGQQRDRSAIETEMDILSSRDLAGRVVDKLDLTDNAVFNPSVASRSEASVPQELKGVIASLVRSVGRAVGPDSEPAPSADSARQRETAITALLGHLDVTRSDESLAIDLQVTTPDPSLSARVANAVGETYVAWTNERREQSLDDTVAMLRKRAQLIATDITGSEQKINSFTKTNNLSTDARDDLLRQRIDGMNSQLTTAGVQLADIRAQVAQGKQVIAGEAALEGTNLSSPLLISLRGQKSDLERQRAQNAINLGPNHPAVRRIEAQIASVDTMIRNELQHIVTDLSGQEKIAVTRVQDLQSQVSSLRTELQQRGLAESQLRGLQRNLTADQDLHTFVVNQLGRLDPFAELVTAGARIVSPATVPTQASFPRRSRILVGGAVGVLILALLGALLLEAGDTTIRSQRQAQAVAGVPNLMSLAQASGRAAGQTGVIAPYVDRTPTMQSEAFRSLYFGCRTHLPGFHSVILMTMPLPAKGTPEIALGLACAAVADGVRTAYLNLDPHVTDEIALADRLPSGTVEDVLARRCALDDAVMVINEVGGLSVLRSRAPLNPLAHSAKFERMRDLVEQLRQHYDLVVINCAPVLLVKDANWLSPLVDAVILNLRYGRTSSTELREAVTSLRTSHAPLIGTALSQVDDGRAGSRRQLRRTLAQRYAAAGGTGGTVA